jgi:hypothetical protein
MEILQVLNPFEWVENCNNCKRPMAHVLLTRERIKLEPGSIHAPDSAPDKGLPAWYYNWSQNPDIIAGAEVAQPGDTPAMQYPTWYCPGCLMVWVNFRGLWAQTSFAPAVPIGVVNSGPIDRLPHEFQQIQQ